MSASRSVFLSLALAVALLVSSSACLDVVVNLNATNATSVAAPLIGPERCRFIDQSITGEDYAVFAGLYKLILTDQGLNHNDTTVKANLLSLCGQMFVGPDALLRKYVVALSGANLTAPVYFGVVDQVNVKGALLLSIVKSAKLVKVLQLINVKSGYMPPAIEFKTTFNETTKQNDTVIVDSQIDVLTTEEWKKYSQETLNVTTADFLDSTLNIVFLAAPAANSTNASDAAKTAEAPKDANSTAEVKASGLEGQAEIIAPTITEEEAAKVLATEKAAAQKLADELAKKDAAAAGIAIEPKKVDSSGFFQEALYNNGFAVRRLIEIRSEGFNQPGVIVRPFEQLNIAPQIDNAPQNVVFNSAPQDVDVEIIKTGIQPAVTGLGGMVEVKTRQYNQPCDDEAAQQENEVILVSNPPVVFKNPVIETSSMFHSNPDVAQPQVQIFGSNPEPRDARVVSVNQPNQGSKQVTVQIPNRDPSLNKVPELILGPFPSDNARPMNSFAAPTSVTNTVVSSVTMSAPDSLPSPSFGDNQVNFVQTTEGLPHHLQGWGKAFFVGTSKDKN